jgi:hypothetical protein
MGKSTMLENMAVQDIKNGEGLAFIDPARQNRRLLLDYVPQERIKDVIYFAPFDLDIQFHLMLWKMSVMSADTWWLRPDECLQKDLG